MQIQDVGIIITLFHIFLHARKDILEIDLVWKNDVVDPAKTVLELVWKDDVVDPTKAA